MVQSVQPEICVRIPRWCPTSKSDIETWNIFTLAKVTSAAIYRHSNEQLRARTEYFQQRFPIGFFAALAFSSYRWPALQSHVYSFGVWAFRVRTIPAQNELYSFPYVEHKSAAWSVWDAWSPIVARSCERNAPRKMVNTKRDETNGITRETRVFYFARRYKTRPHFCFRSPGIPSSLPNCDLPTDRANRRMGINDLRCQVIVEAKGWARGEW